MQKDGIFRYFIFPLAKIIEFIIDYSLIITKSGYLKTENFHKILLLRYLTKLLNYKRVDVI